MRSHEGRKYLFVSEQSQLCPTIQAAEAEQHSQSDLGEECHVSSSLQHWGVSKSKTEDLDWSGCAVKCEGTMGLE